jgi:hypothetical protein
MRLRRRPLSNASQRRPVRTIAAFTVGHYWLSENFDLRQVQRPTFLSLLAPLAPLACAPAEWAAGTP